MYKMSLGKSARYREEALARGVLVFQCEAAFHKAVLSDNAVETARACRRVKTDIYPDGNAPDSAVAVWRRSVITFRSLPKRALIVHWEGELDHLHWGLAAEGFSLAREEAGDWGQPGLVFHRPLEGRWRKTSIGGVPLSNMHPNARDVAVNMATLNRVQTDHEYLRALILDGDTAQWESRPDWIAKARATKGGWFPKDRAALLADRRHRLVTSMVRDVADYFEAEVRRMAATAVHTAAYANGQTVLKIIKNKDIGFSRAELEEEIAALLHKQGHRCALTGFQFTESCSNPHLRPSLDRRDSSLGYVAGNLQVVTRAANFFKSASDEYDWKLKADAMFRMAVAMQRAKRKEEARVQ